MILRRISAPSIEPVSLLEAKNHLRVDFDFTDDDTLISSLITAARERAEMLTRRAFITQQWSLTLDAFPGPTMMGVPFGRSFSVPSHAVVINKSPVQSIQSIQYLDMSGNQQTLATNIWVADIQGEPARITPVFGAIWPPTLPQIASVVIKFTAGFGDTPDTVPEGIKDWIKIRVNTLYENREEVAILTKGKMEDLPYVDSLLDPYKVSSYFA